MNPFLIFYIFLGGGLLWVIISWAFPSIGEFINNIKEDIEGIMEEDEDE